MYIAAFFLSVFLLLLLFKGALFQWALNKQLSAFNANSSYEVSIRKTALSGFSQANLDGIVLRKPNGDSLFFVEHLELVIRPFRILTRNNLIKSLSIDQGFARYERKTKSDSLKTEEPKKENTEEISPLRIYRVFQRYFPSSININAFQLSYSDTFGVFGVNLDSIMGREEALQGSIIISDDQAHQTWHVQGSMNEGIKLIATAEENVPLPAIYTRFGLDYRSDTLSFALENKGMTPEGISLRLSGSINGMRIFHPKLSADTIVFRHLATEMDLVAGNAYLMVDTNSTFVFNQIEGQFGLQFPLTRAGNQYGLLIKTKELPAQNFFTSLPEGAFDDTRNMEVSGDLAYTLRFVLDGNNPNNLFFDSHFDKRNFKIKNYGATNLALMNGSFMHTVYESDRPYRSFQVGPENPSFVPIDAVPQTLINAILVSEDPSFYYHGGFIPEAFRESIVANYKAKSFKRGGSTISMQLVKNVFLSRKKTVFRKIEEALIVWLIEGQHLTSKTRMMEVYLNIIEWGPGVYGIGEASRFYFSKSPSQLTLPECIYLANIIPRPKKFKYGFEQNGNLRQYMVDLQHFILRRMVTKEMITPADTVQYNPMVVLSGAARDLVVPVDSLGIDSLIIDEETLPELIH